ncbi:MAG: tRNA (uridine(34)/cytosine(34)/5-carboxymethylaminomethyluridine(34)-2'-O)-methyltransferase TrmL [Candidatus Cloacimonetes bacterium HGW-Cloacimonetes-2]|jgi:tRNA (cytidine/uridine-2'-O-)-methyltransferase|nr:MAG: tRNA (uridine(34)/cytosine(34)/5-carboxymethylaminomethyluridine(34)-2'-O)-methyltransferase TrmL [Candidatus Cloacimonetes bacterium HGW-Cloacimonetes-2]
MQIVPCDLNIVLFEPEIPANTGNIGRLCLGSGAKLHLIRPIRFLLDDKSLRRAGLDYWHKLDYQIWDSFAELLASDPAANFHFATTKTANSYLDCAYKPGDYIVFGPESRGLPEDLLSENAERCITIPMTGEIRSINLANSVAIVLYEAIRQIGADH